MRLTSIKRFAVVIVLSLTMLLGTFTFPVRADGYNEGIVTFVNSLYADCLGRTADPTGLNDWCNKLATGQITGKQCAYGFFFSREFIEDRVFTPSELVDVYYHVFLNRAADPDGKRYWLSKINGSMDFTVADAILFQGFADSTEFAGKCASYGIIAGNHIETGIDTSNAYSGNYVPTTDDGSGRNMPAVSAEAMDAYWTSQGYEIYYIDLGNGNTQKCYALFYDMTEHNNQVNSYRASLGLNPYPVPTDLSDPRVQYARMRAVEVAYSFSHKPPISYNLNLPYDPREEGLGFTGGRENIYGGTVNGSFEAFRNSPMHNAAMIDGAPPEVSGPVAISSAEHGSKVYYSYAEILQDYPNYVIRQYTTAMTTASCTCVFVNPDGVSVSTSSPTASASYWPDGTPAMDSAGRPTSARRADGSICLPMGYARSTVQCYWQ